jgi:putative transposase
MSGASYDLFLTSVRFPKLEAEKSAFSLPDTCGMKKKRFSEAQIMAILQQQQSGQTVAQIVREHGLSETTFHAWKSKHAGTGVAELTRLKHLEENRKLK